MLRRSLGRLLPRVGPGAELVDPPIGALEGTVSAIDAAQAIAEALRGLGIKRQYEHGEICSEPGWKLYMTERRSPSDAKVQGWCSAARDAGYRVRVANEGKGWEASAEKVD